MLLVELIKEISQKLDLTEDRILSLLNENNIRLEQRLLLSKTPKQEELERCKRVSGGGGRGRGRPKKGCILKEDDVGIYVELLEINGVKYYKTEENVMLTENHEIAGILLNGKIIKKE